MDVDDLGVEGHDGVEACGELAVGIESNGDGVLLVLGNGEGGVGPGKRGGLGESGRSREAEKSKSRKA